MKPDYAGKLKIECRPSPNHGERRAGRQVDMLLLHYTGMESAEGALSWLCNPESEVSAHYFVFEDGRIVQMVPEAERAWHAGQAFWDGETDINSRSIGVEIANPGHAGGSPEFPDNQTAANIDLCQDILSRHQIPPWRVLGHSDVAPERKQDPGEKFDWSGLAKAGIGLWPDIVSSGKDIGSAYNPDDTIAAISEMQKKLSAFGYGIHVTGEVDTQTATIVRAFHLHFRPEQIDEPFDACSMDLLDLLLTSKT